MPVTARIVIFQGTRLLRTISGRILKGSHKKTTLHIALDSPVTRNGGFISISGTAGSLGTYPNTVPLLTCMVDPVRGGGKCA
jgi:hypothetical protein